jgi:8-oxo-dGTP diphosphatase
MASREDVRFSESAVLGDVEDRDGFFATGSDLDGAVCKHIAGRGKGFLVYRAQLMARSTCLLLAQWVHGALRWSTRDRWPPFVGVSAVVELDGTILMLERSDGLGLSLPGGIVMSSETVEEALWREVMEETGYEIEVTGFLDVYSGPWRDPRIPCVEIVYIATIARGQPRSSVEGRPIWMRKERLPKILAFDHQQVLADYFRRKDKICRKLQQRHTCKN